jgi:ABC-type transport system involved in multi-copper enzyme maturation permease subunit
MDALQRFFAILQADVRERMRTPRFWVVLGLMAWATWWCFPPIEAGYSTLSLIDGSRGRYSSAWAGMSLALVYSTLLNLAGFYLVRGTLTRDIETRVWQLLVTTPMTRGGYLLAKWASHMAVFGMIAMVSVVVALVAQWVRAEDRHIDLIELLKPLVLLSLPSLALTAMFAIWFDLVPWLRRTAGNVLFFVVWAVMLTVSLAPYDGQTKADPQGWTSDPGGIAVAARELDRVREAQTGKPLAFGINIGGNPMSTDAVRFDWPAWHPGPKVVASRALWLALAMLLTLMAAPLLDWAASRGVSKAKARSGAGRSMAWLNRVLDPFARGPLGILTVAELKLALRQRAIWWWLAALVVLGVQTFAPQESMRIALLFAWILPLDVLAHSVLRERDHGTGALVFTAPNILKRLLATRFLVGFTMLFALSLPTLVRLLISEPLAALAALTAIAAITSWGLCLGALCRNARPFELLMVGTVYVCLNGATVFDPASHPLSTLTLHASALLPALLLLAWAWPRLARR